MKDFIFNLDGAVFQKSRETKHREVFGGFMKNQPMLFISFHLLPSQMDGETHNKMQTPPLIKKRNLKQVTSAAEPVLVV